MEPFGAEVACTFTVVRADSGAKYSGNSAVFGSQGIRPYCSFLQFPDASAVSAGVSSNS